MTFLQKQLPHHDIKNIRIFYIIGILNVGYVFIQPNWMFYMSEFVTLPQIGIIEAVGIFTAIVAEIPSGAIADLLGKKKSLILGTCCNLIGGLIFVFFPTFWGFIIGNIIGFYGFSLLSGTQEAFGYDSLKDKKLAKAFPKVIGANAFLATIFTLLFTIISGYTYSISIYMPFILFSAIYGISTIVMFWASEPKSDSEKFTFNNFWKQQYLGAKQLFAPKLIVAAAILIILGGVLELHQGMVRQSSSAFFGFDGETTGYLMAIAAIPALLISKYFATIYKFLGKFWSLIAVAVLYFVAFAGSVFAGSKLLFGGLMMIFIFMSATYLSPLTSVMLNDRIPSKYRATSISVAKFITRIPYLLLIIFFADLLAPATIVFIFVAFCAILTLPISMSIFGINKL